MGEIFVYVIFFFFGGAALLTIWHDRQAEKHRRKEAEKMLELAEKGSAVPIKDGKVIGTRDLFLETLTKIGCQYQLGEGDDTRIFFAYQGEHFFADTTNETYYVHLWDTHWGHVELYDIDEVSRLRKAINTSNINTMVSTIYTIDDEGSNVDVHSKSIIPFIPSMPDIEDYLKAELYDFFRAHQMVKSEMTKLREKENA